MPRSECACGATVVASLHSSLAFILVLRAGDNAERDLECLHQIALRHAQELELSLGDGALRQTRLNDEDSESNWMGAAHLADLLKEIRITAL